MVLALMLMLSLSARARAETAPAQSSSDASLGFDLFADEKQKTPQEKEKLELVTRNLERKVKLRRSMLEWHQGFGFATLGLLAATLVIGQLNYQDKFSPDGEYTGRYNQAHLDLGVTTSALFAVTGTLALFAPNPYPKPIKLDAALLHKVSMAAATACFLAQVILGPISLHEEGTLHQRPLALAHLVVGYGAFAFMATGTIAYVAK
jgi:cytochrome b561